MTALLVIRHAATEWNEGGRIQGRTDVPLSEAGRARIRTLRLPEGWAGAQCLASPLSRAIETARLLGLDPKPEPRLIEMAWGAWEGRRLPDLRADLGEEMAENENRGLDFRPPGGESPRDVQERLKPWLAELAGPTVAVTHKGVVRALYALATGWDMRAKAPQRLMEGRAHLFAVGTDGAVAVHSLNVPLVSR